MRFLVLLLVLIGIVLLVILLRKTKQRRKRKSVRFATVAQVKHFDANEPSRQVSQERTIEMNLML